MPGKVLALKPPHRGRSLRGRHRPRLQGTPLHCLRTIYMAAGLAKGEMKQWGLRSGVRGNKPTRGGGFDQIGLTHPLTASWDTPISTLGIVIIITITITIIITKQCKS